MTAPRRFPPWAVFGGVLIPAAALRLSGLVPAGTPSGRTAAAGAILAALGLLLAVWSVFALLRFDGAHPVQAGPFRISRHPMYLGMLLILLATGVGAAEWVLVATTPLIAALVDRLVVRPEELELEAVFGDDYRAYARSVRRWL